MSNIDFQRRTDLQNVVYAVLHSKADLLRSINPEKPGAGDWLLREMLEWGWEHHAPLGKRYRLHATQHFQRELNLDHLSTLDPVSAAAEISKDVDVLIEEARAACTSNPLDSLTLHGNATPSTVWIWAQIIFAPTETETPLPS